MATLTEDQKLYAVNRFACFDTPQQVADALKEEYGVDVPRSQLVVYDHTRPQHGKAKAGKKWAAIFDDRRKRFLEELAAIPIANKAYRLERLSMLLTNAISKKNAPLAASLMEQAAKEIGGMYNSVRRLEHTGAEGAPLESMPRTVRLVGPDEIE